LPYKRDIRRLALTSEVGLGGPQRVLSPRNRTLVSQECESNVDHSQRSHYTRPYLLKLPSGSQWLHEIKHDGFRVIARKTGAQVRLYSRPGNDLTRRLTLIVETLARLRSRSCIIDGEAVACDDNGVASFDLIRHQRANGSIFLYAFDLIELNGDDLRRDPLEVRKAALASIVAKASPGIRFDEHMEGDGPTVFAHACKMGLEGIVSKRKDSAYRSGRSPDWLKMKNSDAPAVKREAEEDWGR
jgi:bifunctional non-homologous end joining protein LigD